LPCADPSTQFLSQNRKNEQKRIILRGGKKRKTSGLRRRAKYRSRKRRK
jgi:hypothetical protein